MASYINTWSGQIYYTTTSSNSSTGYYTIGNNYYGHNSTSNYRPKSRQEYKNSEMKHILDKERGW